MNKVITIVIVICLSGCYSNMYEVEPCETTSVEELSYSLHIKPIINVTCAIVGCHVVGFEKGNFTNPEEVIEKAKSGKLEFMITTEQMPNGATHGPQYLTNCEITTIKRWIQNGAQNN